MRSKKLIFPAILLLLPGIMQAQNSFANSYKPGDKLYVFSRDGLSLREQADPKGKLILVASYGDEVMVLADDKPAVSFTNSNISGAWVRVKTVKETNTPPNPKSDDYLQHYNTYGRIDFANGAIHESISYEGGASIVTKFPINAFTFQEVFLLARIAYPEFFSQKKCDYKVDHMECQLDEYHSLLIKKDADFIVVFYGMAD